MYFLPNSINLVASRGKTHSLSDDIPVVLDVMGQFMLLYGSEPCLPEIFAGLLLAPHGAQPFASLSQ